MKHFALHHLWRLAAVLLAILIYPAQFARGAVQIDGIYYNLGADTAEVAQNYNYAGDIVIPATVNYNGQTYTVTAIGSNAFNYCGSVTSVTIGPNVKWIQYNAFRYTGISSITIPASVVYVNYPLFDGCENLETIVVEEGNPRYDSRGGCNAIILTAKNTMVCGCKNTVIPNDVTEIYHKALGFRSLTSIDIPASVRILQPGVFEGSGLTSIVIPATLTTLFDNPFQDCPDLTSIVVEEGNPRYDSRDNCNGIIETDYNRLVTSCPTTVIPESVTSIGEMSFSRRYDLTTFTAPDQIKEIARNAFYDCTNLQSITFSDNVELIDQAAFYWCDNLKTVTIGSGIKQMGEAVFGRCNKLTDVYINAITPPTTSGDPFLDGNNQVVIHVPDEAVDAYESTSPWSKYTIEGGASTMSGIMSTFNTVEPITTSDTNNSYANLHSEENNTWWGVYWYVNENNALTFTNLSTTAGDIPCVMANASQSNTISFHMENKFEVSGPIKKVIVNATGGMQRIICEILKNETDSQGDQVKWVEVNSNPGLFEDYTFDFDGREYTNAKIRITFEGERPVFVHSVFIVQAGGSSGPKLKGTTGDVTWEATDLNKEIGVWENGEMVVKHTYRITFSGNGATADYESKWNYSTQTYDNTAPWAKLGVIGEVVANEGVTGIGSEAFSHQEYLELLSLPSTIRYIGYDAFFACYGLTEVTFPYGLNRVGNGAFQACSGVKSIHIPATLINMNAQAFQSTRFETITVDENNPKFYSPEGSACILLKENNELFFGSPFAVIPNVVTSIGRSAFYNANMTQMVIPNGVETIKDYAFYYCTQLTEMELPPSVTTIGDNAFAYCNVMTKFTIGSGVTSIGSNQFTSVKNNNVLTSVLADVYCYANPNTLSWTDYANTNSFMADKATKFHVPANYLQAWQTNFPDINATYVGDLDGDQPVPVTDYKFLAFGVEVTSENCADIKVPGVTGHINYDPMTNVLTLQDVTANGQNQEWTWAVVWADGFFSNHNEFNMTILLKGTNVITNSGEAFGGHNFTFVGDTPDASLTVDGRKRAINAVQEAVIDGCILDLTSTERDVIGGNKLTVKNGAYVHLKSPEGQLLTEITEEPIFGEGIDILTASVNVSRKQNSKSQWVWCFTLDATPDEGSVLNATEVTIGAPKGATIDGIHYSFDPITLQATVVSDAAAKYKGDINIPGHVTFESRNYTVTAIDEWAFDECTEVTNITLPSTLTFIGQDAFSYCDNVKELMIPASVTVIGPGAFSGMRGLEMLRVEEGNPVYDSRENCNAVVRTAQNEVYGACKNTTYPASITAMGRAALLNHWELTNLDLPENITYIGFNSVSNATNVTTVRLRGQITDIRYASFTGYNSLKDFYIYATTPPAIQRNVFIIDDYAYSTEIDQVTLHVPAASVDAYAAANVWKEFGKIVAIEGDFADISPITEEKIVEMIKLSTTTMKDAIVDEVYYNLDSDNGNGYDKDDDCIVIAQTTDMSQIEDKKPGSEEVKEEFKGIILKVEAGEGVLSIDAKTVGSNKLAVQFGNFPPELVQSSEKQTIKVAYKLKHATYIYIYAVSGAAGVKGRFLAPSVENGVKIYGFSIDPTIDEIPENIPVVDEEKIATDIAEVEATREGSAIYDTAGRRIGKAVRKQGIYITNKRKVAVK